MASLVYKYSKLSHKAVTSSVKYFQKSLLIQYIIIQQCLLIQCMFARHLTYTVWVKVWLNHRPKHLDI